METGNTPVPDVKNLQRSLMVLAGAIMMGLLMFTAVMLGLVSVAEKKIIEDETIIRVFTGASVVLALTMGIFGLTFYRRKLAALQQASFSSVFEKLNQFKKLLLVYLAFCEGPGIFSVICFFLTGHFTFLIITGLMLLAMFIKLPTKSRLISELQLDWQEQQELY